MDGIHDLGGMQGFGPVHVEPDEPVFHAPWEGRVFALAGLALAAGVGNGDAFRHAIERLEPVTYLTAGYYGRWLAALERVLRDAGVLGQGELDARVAGAPTAGGTWTPAGPPSVTAVRTIDAPPRFAVGDAVRARDLHPSGHTRLPRYVRGRPGVVARVHPACVFPDAHAHGRGEQPQHVYAVRFAARDLWGDGAEAGAVVHVDLFETYLEPGGAAGG